MKKIAQLFVVVIFPFAVFSQMSSSPVPSPMEEQIVGKWLGIHRSRGGLGTIYEFARGGKLEMTIGAIVEGPFRAEGDSLTFPSGSTKPDAKPNVIKFRIEGDTLIQWHAQFKGSEMRFIRRSPKQQGAAPIVGIWAEDTTARPFSQDSGKQIDDKSRTVMAEMARRKTYEYTRDGVMKVLVPMSTIKGTYSLTDQTFKLENQSRVSSKAQVGHFRLKEGLLILTMSDGKTEEPYIRSDATKEELIRAGISYGDKTVEFNSLDQFHH